MGKKIGIAVGAVLALVALVAGAYALISNLGGSGGRSLDEMATFVPADTHILWTMGAPMEGLAFAAEHAPKGAFDDLKEEVGFDLFDEAAWNDYGLDPTAPVFMAFLDMEAEAFMVAERGAEAMQQRLAQMEQAIMERPTAPQVQEQIYSYFFVLEEYCRSTRTSGPGSDKPIPRSSMCQRSGVAKKTRSISSKSFLFKHKLTILMIIE